MATLVHPIESVPGAQLSHLFDEETSVWARDLLWSFAPTRRRLESAFAERTLHGFVANDDLGACAYATYATDGVHGIVGSVFTAGRSRGRGLEALLVRHVLDRLLLDRPRTIDCQTLFSSDPGHTEPFAARGFASAPRLYMTLDRSGWLAARRGIPPGFRSKPADRADLGSVARLVYESHKGGAHLDASSSFDTLDSCERILGQIMVDEVCGRFDPQGSRRVDANGQLVAASLLTWPLPGVAHISEVATAPSHRRLGLARHCLTESLTQAFDHGEASAVTLSVTASNRGALALYESMGFAPRIRYESHVLRDPPR